MPLSRTAPNNFSTLNMQDMVDTFDLKKTNNISFPKSIERIKIEPLILRQINKFQNDIENWNETELSLKQLGLILASVDFDGLEYSSFAERNLNAKIDHYYLNGNVDFVVAKGKYEPRNPYFFIQEFKKAKNPSGDPLPQLLGEMLVAQELNQNKLIYGTYIVGRFWYFIAMKGREFTELSPLDSTNLEDLEIILSHLNWVKEYIEIEVKK